MLFSNSCSSKISHKCVVFFFWILATIAYITSWGCFCINILIDPSKASTDAYKIVWCTPSWLMLLIDKYLICLVIYEGDKSFKQIYLELKEIFNFYSLGLTI